MIFTWEFILEINRTLVKFVGNSSTRKVIGSLTMWFICLFVNNQLIFKKIVNILIAFLVAYFQKSDSTKSLEIAPPIRVDKKWIISLNIDMTYIVSLCNWAKKFCSVISHDTFDSKVTEGYMFDWNIVIQSIRLPVTKFKLF